MSAASMLKDCLSWWLNAGVIYKMPSLRVPVDAAYWRAAKK